MERMTILKIDGKEFGLILDWNQIAAAERAGGCNLLAALTEPGAINAAALRGLLHASIVSPRLSLGEVGKLITIASLPKILDAIGEMIRASSAEGEHVAHVEN